MPAWRRRNGGSAREQRSGAHLHRRVAKAGEGASLDLANPLAAEVDQLADLVGGAGLTAVEPEAQRQDVALALVEHRQQLLDLGREHGPGRRLVGRLGAAVLDQVAELRLAVLTDGRLERHRLREVRDELLDPLGREVELLGELVERRGTAEARLEPRALLLEPGEVVGGMDGQADGAPGVGDAALDRLADPPRGVRGELEPLAPVELLDRVDEAEVALLDEVEQREAGRLVLLRNRHHKTQVRLHERALRVVAEARGAAQLTLLGGRERLPTVEQLPARTVALLDLL